MKIVNMDYMVSSPSLSDDLEGNVVFCETLEEAKDVGNRLADLDSDPIIIIWQNTGLGEWTPIRKGRIPDPEFAWFEM